MIRRRQMVVEDLQGLVESAAQRERLGEPESAQYEGTLIGVDAVGRVVAAQEASATEFVNHALDRAIDTWIAGREEAIDGHEEQGGVDVVSTVLAHERSDAVVVPLVEHFDHDPVPRGAPVVLVHVATEEGCDVQRAVERDPGHELRVHVVCRNRPRLPDAVVGLDRVLDCLVDELADLAPQAEAEGSARLLVE